MKKKAKTKVKVQLAPCFNCKKPVKQKDYYCHGCHVVVCGKCNVAGVNIREGHGTDDHLAYPWEITQDEVRRASESAQLDALHDPFDE